MRQFVIVIFLLSIWFPSVSQHGNEWINFSQPHFKIPTAQNGIYKLTYSGLVAAGIPSAIDPRSIRVFHRGIEQAIYVQGETDGILNSTDYVEFYGRRNDGSPDKELYPNPAFQPHSNYNLYSDTTCYFLTFGSGQGKRMDLVSESSSGLAPESFHWDEKLLLATNEYSVGVDYGNYMQTAFDLGEGWTGSQINHGQKLGYTIEGITNKYTAGPVPILEILLTGRGLMNHAVEIYATGRLVKTVAFTGYNSEKVIQSLQWPDISSDGKIFIEANVLGVNGSSDRISVGYVKIRYPQQTDMDNGISKILNLVENVGGRSYIQIADAPAGTKLYDISDPNAVRQIDLTVAGSLNAVVNSTSISKTIFATSSPITPEIRLVTFRQIIPSQHDYVIITHPSLRKPVGGYTDPVKAYGEYRSLEAGGGYDTLIVNIDQLYDQFNSGEKSPLAIYRFMKYLQATSPPKYLFLIGKGLDVNYNYFRSPGTFTTYKDLIPAAGLPASDAAFTAGLSGTPYVPSVATGRLTATSPQDVASYLNKIKVMEAKPFDDLRRKNILHLSGGIKEGEPQLFKSYLQSFERLAESYNLGGHVTSVAKQAVNQQVINVADEINAGVNLITFFGHSATTATDFDLGNVTDPVYGYNNKDKYPLLLMNGCYSGSVFLNATIFGENWVNTPDRGSIGLIAHTSLGFDGLLKNYSSLLYQIAYCDELFINKGIGDVQKETAKRFLNEYYPSVRNITQAQQMVLLGDPAYRLFGARKPDFEIKTEGISIQSYNGEPITALLDSIKLNVVVKNFGIAKNQNFKVSITRTFADGSTEVYQSTVPAVLYSDTLSFKIRGQKEKGFGSNTFAIKVDADNSIDELNENNNEVSYVYFIPLSRTQNLFPNNFAIVNTLKTNLTFQHTDQLADERIFLLEVDTLKTFTSGYKKQFELERAVIATMALDLLSRDSLTYYWRTKLKEPLATESNEWDLSSFTYIEDGAEGWAQMHFSQFEGNGFSQLVADPEIRRLEFTETVTDIAIRTFGSAAGKPVDSVSFKINGAEYNSYSDAGGLFGCRNNTINFIAFEKQTTQPYPGIYLTWADMLYTYGGKRLTCGREPYVINSYLSSELIMGNDADIIHYIDNIPAGDSIILFNIGDAGYASWPVAAKTKLGELGISVAQIDNIQAGAPLVILARKGAAVGSAKIITASAGIPNEQRLKVSATVTGRTTKGSMLTSAIGPAQSWGQFKTRVAEKETSDVVTFNIIGVNGNGEEVVLKADIPDDTDISDIDASTYRFVKIQFASEDPTFVTSSQLKNLIVTFEPIAEGLAFYTGSLEPQTLQEGQTWTSNFRFVNISNRMFTDSLTVSYDVINPSTQIKTERIKKIKAPVPGDTTVFQLSFTSVAQDGLNNLEIFVNPRVSPEQRYDNNTISLRNFINVATDANPPVIDVLFDGRHIGNEEFVSANPSIEITIWDENPYLLKTDTLGVKIFHAHPCDEDDCNFKAVYFSRNDVQWEPATASSEFKIHFSPEDLSDGVHKFRVEAADANGNSSAATPYEIIFQVKNSESVFIASPYPNPFSYQSTFEFVLTGENTPEGLTLEILSTKGEVVQKFDETSIENLRSGTNQILWNGVDGNQRSLPSGIYLFRFTITVANRDYIKTGKLVLIR
jgi:hypothetical protein